MHNKSLIKLGFLFIFLFFTSVSNAAKKAPALPAAPKVIAIEVTGQKKIEKEAVLARIATKPGDEYSEKKIAEDIRILYKMGFFIQVEVFKDAATDGVNLEYKVIEKPTIAEIVFEGNNEIKSDDLEAQLPIKAFEILNYAKVQEAVEKLEKHYEEKGFYLVKIEPTVETITADETVKLKFTVTENDKVKVKKITFLGNEKLKDNFLKDRLMTTEAGFFTGMSSSGSFKQEAFERDMTILKFKYWNLGYLQVKIDRPLVTVTPDKKSIYITYHIEEGEQYSVGEVDFAGDLVFEKSELMDAIKIKDNGIFSVEVMHEDHWEARPARPHLQGRASAPLFEIAAVLDVFIRHAGSVERFAGLAWKRVLPHAHHHHGVARHGLLHFDHDGALMTADLVAHGAVDVLLGKYGSGHVGLL